MKTYTTLYTLLACIFVISCSKIESVSEGPDIDEPKGVAADYSLLLVNGNILTSQLLNVDGESMTLNTTDSSFSDMNQPEITYRNGDEITFYQKNGNCTGTITKHDFGSNISKDIEVYTDLADCSLTTTSISNLNNLFFLGYTVDVTDKTKTYAVRIVDTDAIDVNFNDIVLDKKPIAMAIAKNRLFVLTLDIDVTNDNSLSVIDLNTNVVISEIALGLYAKRIFVNSEENIIISYDDLHTTLNSTTLAVEYTNYESGKETDFTSSEFIYFDTDGKLYYPKISGSFSSYPVIPSVYDFSTNLMTLYVYENFLTETQQTVEYNIETTTMVSYDIANDYIVIGYKKNSGAQTKGGILRIKPSPEPKFIDNIDLDAVPYYIFMK